MRFRRLYPYWRCAWRESLAGGVLLALAVAFELLQPWPVKWLVDYVFTEHPPPDWLSFLVATSPLDKGATIGLVCGAIVVFFIAHRAASVCSQLFLIAAGARTTQSLRCHACDHLLNLSLSYHDRTKVGDSIYRVAYDTHAVQSLLSGALVPMASGALLLTGILLVMWQLDWRLTIVAIAITPIFWGLIKGFGRSIDLRTRSYHENESRLVSSFQETLISIRAVQAFGREGDMVRQFGKHAEKSFQTSSRLIFVQLVFSACVGLAMAVGTAVVVWFGAIGVIEGRLTVGDILVFMAYLGMLYQPMNAFSHGASVAQSAGSQLDRVFEVFRVRPDIESRPGALVPPSVTGRVECRHVLFAYETERPVLNGLDLTINPGEVVALVGRTGAGKSTLASLILRFYDPQKGAVFLDGRDLKDLDVGWLRGQVALVLQEPILFSATIGENIGFGRAGATSQEIEAAARNAQIHDFIRTLPDGYNTSLGERGVNLSVGQKQRLGIARAFVKNAPILILDEPTSALDPQTEVALLQSIRQLVRGRTTILIAHRISTLGLAHRIVVLDCGMILEEGTHEQLMLTESVYRKLYMSQSRESQRNHEIIAEPVT
jgi:ATP-binding cassette subfamily B protein/subfamily B ATP-binding cassette protein MsbA